MVLCLLKVKLYVACHNVGNLFDNYLSICVLISSLLVVRGI